MIISLRRAVEFWQADITPDPSTPNHYAAVVVEQTIRDLSRFCLKNGFDLETWQSGRLGTVRVICRSERAGRAMSEFASSRRIQVQHQETFMPAQIRDRDWVCDDNGWKLEK